MIRIFTTIAFFLVSSLGLFFALMIAASDKDRFGMTLVLLSWAISLLVLLHAAIAWIRGIQLGRTYSMYSLGIGCIALLSLPVHAALERPTGFEASSPLLSAVSSLVVEISLVFPLIGLAVHLNRFHSATRSAGA